jgi:hypothetical protein
VLCCVVLCCVVLCCVVLCCGICRLPADCGKESKRNFKTLEEQHKFKLKGAGPLTYHL